jgi:Putative outer membrane beta-barrel porin, MtrB/PioB
MRNRLTIGTAALLLASATWAGAQEAPQPEATTTSSGTLDLGGRFTSTTGDEARYERYRDLRDGVNANFLYDTQRPDWMFDFLAKNIGYRDGHYQLNFENKRIKLTAYFDQTPLNYAYYTRTPYNCTAGSCALNPDLRMQVQNGTAVGVPQNVGDLAAGSIYDSIAHPFDLRSRRDTVNAQLRISATNNFDFIFGVNSYKRTGNMPSGASYGFNYATEMPIVIDNRETELSAAVEWASHQGMFHFGFEHAKFDQNVPSFTFDNPSRATDYCVYHPDGTCYDPSGYVNGNGPAFGRMSQPPSNSLDTVNWMGMVKLPGRTTANGSFSIGANHQDAALIPWTTNSSIANPAVYALFPNLASLPRDTAQMRVDYASGSANVRSRPIKDVTLTARYRFNSRNDFTRGFDGIEYVRFDAVPEETGGISEPFNYSRNTFDVNAAYTGIPYSTVRVGYGYNQLEHGVRTAQGWQDNTARVSYDIVGNEYVTLRAQYEHTKRDTINLSIAAIEETGSQPALRFYDEAARTRNRGTVMLQLTPLASVGIDFTLSTGKDDYQGADSAQEFGLLNNKNTAYTVSVNYTPSAKVNVGAEYGRETYNALQESRNANPGAQFTDPSLNWNLTNDESANYFSAYVNLIRAIEKTDIRVGYDYNDSNQGFLFGGPRIGSLTAAGQFVPLPDVTHKWQQATVDVRYFVSKKFGLGFFYMYEKFDIEDFATINTAGPQSLPVAALGPQTDTARIDWLGEISTGYAARPYKGQTGIVRVFYEF